MATFRSAHGKYLCWDPVANVLVANRDEPASWEQFEIVPLENGKVAIRAHNGKFLTAESNRSVVARGENPPYAWEEWERVLVEGRVAFYSGNDAASGYLTAELDGTVVVRSETPDAWQQWTIEGRSSSGTSSPLDPTWGCARLDGEVFVDNRGPFVPIGLHFGEAFSAFCRGREKEVEDQLRVAVSHGYNFHRTWDNLGYYSAWRGREVSFTSFRGHDGVQVHPTRDYYQRWVEYLQMCSSVGIRVAFDSGDLNALNASIITEHLHRIRQAMDQVPHVIFSRHLANEKWQNFPSGLATDENFAVRVMREAFGGSPYILGNSAPEPSSDDSNESGVGFKRMTNGFFPLSIVHGTRNFGDMEFVMRRFFNYGYERYVPNYNGPKYAQISLEPGGPGNGVTVGRTSEVWKIVGMHIATLIGRSATVYMSGRGVFWDGPIQDEPGFAEVGQLSQIFPTNAFTFRSTHGNRSDVWFTSEGGFANDGRGYGRVDQLISDSNRFGLCIAHGGRGTRRVVTNRNVSVKVMGLDLSHRYEAQFHPGQSFDVIGDAFITASLL